MLDLVKRRARVIAAVTLFGCLGSLILAISQTHQYASTEVLQVSRPTIDNDLARSTVDGSSARRLQLIEQRLMARDTVLEIADQFGIFDGQGRMPASERVALMREAVSIQGVAAAREGFTDDGTVSVLRITAVFDSPEKAQGVAHEFANRTIEISANSRIEQARETLRFFTEEEDKLIAELEALERQVATYRLENDIAIDGGMEVRQTQFAAINEAMLEIEGEKLALEQQFVQLDQSQRAATLERQQNEIRAQIAVLDEQMVLLEARLQALTQSIEVSPEIERDLGVFERQREKLQDELDVISARRADAEVGFKLEEGRQAERLTVIESATVPDQPITPSRKRTAILGTLASVFLGLGIAFLMDLRHPVIRSAQQMKSRVGITPVVTIPPLDPNQDQTTPLEAAKVTMISFIEVARNRLAERNQKS